jgi:hypothetical protein
MMPQSWDKLPMDGLIWVWAAADDSAPSASLADEIFRKNPGQNQFIVNRGSKARYIYDRSVKTPF